MYSLYTVYKCKSRNSNKRDGHLHFSNDGDKTLCGKTITDMWYIVDNTFTGKATCPICLSRDGLFKSVV